MDALAFWMLMQCSQVSAFPHTSVALSTADADVAKEITSSRYRFPKPIDQYEALSVYGLNIVASEGDDWKRYRKIAAPAFSDRNNKLVWEETVKIMDGLFDEVWKNQDVVTVDHCLDITLPIALFVIGVAGFGKSMTWHDEDQGIPAGHSLSFKDSLHTASVDITIKLLFPDILLKYGTPRLRRVRKAYQELGVYMAEMVQERTASEKAERHDLFTNLLEANNDDSDGVRLTSDELIGNIFIFLLAGHETTAHTLCFTFALLAMHEDEQEKLFQHIKTTLPDGRMPTYDDMPRLTYSMAVFYETLRLFPPAPLVPKISSEDTVLTVGNIHGQKRVVPVAKGTRVIVHIPGLHYNPRYWDDPESFRPSRFLSPDWNRDAFLPFSAGARACLGRKFFETEGIAALTMLVSRYKIKVKYEPEFAAESFEQRYNRILKAYTRLTLTPERVPLTFLRRS
uniref:Cytochrome P450 n=1 Tax=Psilocybe cubensis TaxID=181762 RepID=A0A8H7XL65_PSICU